MSLPRFDEKVPRPVAPVEEQDGATLPRLVGVMRQFEMLHKAVSIGNEMNKKAIEEVARVGS